MGNAEALAFIYGPFYLVLGLSVLLYAKSWQKLVGQWQSDHFSLFPVTLFMMLAGLVSIYFYNVWEWNLWLLVTITGWAFFVKGAFYMLAPGSLIKSILKMKNSTGMLYFGGLASLVIGAALSYNVFFV